MSVSFGADEVTTVDGEPLASDQLAELKLALAHADDPELRGKLAECLQIATALGRARSRPVLTETPDVATGAALRRAKKAFDIATDDVALLERELAAYEGRLDAVFGAAASFGASAHVRAVGAALGLQKGQWNSKTQPPASEGDNGDGVGAVGCPAFGGGNDEGLGVAVA